MKKCRNLADLTGRLAKSQGAKAKNYAAKSITIFQDTLIVSNLGDFVQIVRIETASIRVQPSIMNRNRLYSRKNKVSRFIAEGKRTT